MTQLTDRPAPQVVDPTLWPDIVTVPTAHGRELVAKLLWTRIAKRMPIRCLMPDGTVLGRGGLDGPVMVLRRPDAFYRRLATSGLVGFGEAFMAGDWESDELASVLTVLAGEIATLVPPVFQRLRDVVVLHQPSSDDQSKANQKQNIARHYDLSNELFTLFLDDTMTYSSALFTLDDVGVPQAEWDGLEAAQQRKVDRLLDSCGVTKGSTVLEIGTGWGELSLRAAARGAKVLSVTLSEEQQALARERIAKAGLSDLVDVELRDYRDVEGTFDAVVSVEMIEAVGYKYWPVYFATLDARLKPGGKVGIQAITMPHDRMEASKDTFTWIHKYIFPGGIIPSVEAIKATVAEHTALRVSGELAIGGHYAETLRLWRARFEAAAEQVDKIGFDATFRRMWSLYLAYSEAGFRSGYLDVYQFVFEKRPSAAPTSVEI